MQFMIQLLESPCLKILSTFCDFSVVKNKLTLLVFILSQVDLIQYFMIIILFFKFVRKINFFLHEKIDIEEILKLRAF